MDEQRTCQPGTAKRRAGMRVTQIDPFRERQVPDVAGRFLKERDRQKRQADLMWLGTMAAMFTDHELRLLYDLGFLCQNDCDLLKQAGRPITSNS